MQTPLIYFNAGSDAGTQQPAVDAQGTHKGGSRKKQKPGKKAAKSAATGSGGQPDEAAVEYLVATEAYQEQKGVVMSGEPRRHMASQVDGRAHDMLLQGLHIHGLSCAWHNS